MASEATGHSATLRTLRGPFAGQQVRARPHKRDILSDELTPLCSRQCPKGPRLSPYNEAMPARSLLRGHPNNTIAAHVESPAL